MPDPSKRTPENVPGKFYVDDNCLDHAMCQHLAPKNFTRDDAAGQFYVSKQPETAEETAQCKKAVECCPMGAIGVDGLDAPLPGWTFKSEEVSMGVYRVRGVDAAGRSVEATGTDPDALLEDCKRSAIRLSNP